MHLNCCTFPYLWVVPHQFLTYYTGNHLSCSFSCNAFSKTVWKMKIESSQSWCPILMAHLFDFKGSVISDFHYIESYNWDSVVILTKDPIQISSNPVHSFILSQRKVYFLCLLSQTWMREMWKNIDKTCLTCATWAELAEIDLTSLTLSNQLLWRQDSPHLRLELFEGLSWYPKIHSISTKSMETNRRSSDWVMIFCHFTIDSSFFQCFQGVLTNFHAFPRNDIREIEYL